MSLTPPPSMPAPRFCDYCGAPLRELKDGACPFCGVPVATATVASPRQWDAASGVSDVVLGAVGDNKIAVIKVVREHTGLHLREAKDLVDAADRQQVLVRQALSDDAAHEFAQDLARAGATAHVVAGGAGSPAPPPPSAPDGPMFDVVLHQVGRKNKIQVIKIVREHTGLGLKEAKDLVDAADVRPTVMAAGRTYEDALAFSDAISATGATSSVAPHS